MLEGEGDLVEALMKAHKWKISHLIIGSLIGLIMSSAIFLSHLISEESIIMLVIFNLLFISLIFPLDGPLSAKTILLSAGNIIGFAWNYLFYLFLYDVTISLKVRFDSAFIIVSPIANLLWIVSFWSISLTTLSSSKTRLRCET